MKKLIRAIDELFRGRPIANARQALMIAMSDLSRRTAETEYYKMLANFHTDEALSMDPHQHWWEFAEHKQKAFDNQLDWAAEEIKRKEAANRLAACQDRYNKLKEKS